MQTYKTTICRMSLYRACFLILGISSFSRRTACLRCCTGSPVPAAAACCWRCLQLCCRAAAQNRAVPAWLPAAPLPLHALAAGTCTCICTRIFLERSFPACCTTKLISLALSSEPRWHSVLAGKAALRQPFLRLCMRGHSACSVLRWGLVRPGMGKYKLLSAVYPLSALSFTTEWPC